MVAPFCGFGLFLMRGVHPCSQIPPTTRSFDDAEKKKKGQKGVLRKRRRHGAHWCRSRLVRLSCKMPACWQPLAPRRPSGGCLPTTTPTRGATAPTRRLCWASARMRGAWAADDAAVPESAVRPCAPCGTGRWCGVCARGAVHGRGWSASLLMEGGVCIAVLRARDRRPRQSHCCVRVRFVRPALCRSLPDRVVAAARASFFPGPAAWAALDAHEIPLYRARESK